MIRRGRGYLKVREEPAPEASVQLEREGYTVVRGLFTTEEVAELRSEIGAVYDRDPPDMRGSRGIEDMAMFRYAMLNRSAAAQRAVANPRLLEVIEPLLGEDCHVIANTAWRLNRIPFLEAEVLSQDTNPQSLIPLLATLGLHGSRLSRQFQKAIEQLREMQEERRHLERRQLTEAAELFLRHRHKGLPWEPADHGFVFSQEQIERHARQLIRNKPAFYATLRGFQADPPPAGAAF